VVLVRDVLVGLAAGPGAVVAGVGDGDTGEEGGEGAAEGCGGHFWGVVGWEGGFDGVLRGWLVMEVCRSWCRD